jgi:hypothetical protein
MLGEKGCADGLRAAVPLLTVAVRSRSTGKGRMTEPVAVFTKGLYQRQYMEREVDS